MRERLPLLLAACWWGSLTTIGLLVVPLLFAHLPTPALAGGMAARLFAAQTWVSVLSGLLLLMCLRSDAGAASEAAERGALLFLVVSGLLLALLSEFAVAPRIVARENLRLWHGLGSGLYLLQWLCAAALLWRLARRPAA